MKDDRVPLCVSVTINGKRVELSLKQFIVLEDWNPREEQGKGMHPEIIQLNRYLQQVKSRIVECYRQLQLQGKVPTAELVKNEFLGVTEDRPTLLKLVDYHNETMLGVLAPGTLKNYYTTVKYLKVYISHRYKVKDYPLADLSYQFITYF